jgi:DNA-binding transcriptional regulator YiaG
LTVLGLIMMVISHLHIGNRSGDKGVIEMTPSDLIQTRKALGLSQRQFGEAVGISARTIRRMERGSKQIDTRTALAVQHIAQKP